MYEQKVSEVFDWSEDENGDLIDPRARRWEEEWNVICKTIGSDPLFVDD